MGRCLNIKFLKEYPGANLPIMAVMKKALVPEGFNLCKTIKIEVNNNE